MIPEIEIEIVAGEILIMLEEANQQIDIDSIRHSINARSHVILMAIGLIIKERYAVVEETEGRSCMRQDAPCDDEKTEAPTALSYSYA